MIGVGIDIVEIDRLRQALLRRPSLADRVFSARERTALAGRRDVVPSLAVRFAAKEAAMKALGTGIGGVAWAEIEVIADSGGVPRLSVSGRAAGRAEALGISRFHVSLSHTQALATAFVVAE